MSAFLSPVFGAGAQFFNNTGAILAGGKIFTYYAGSTSNAPTWTDSTQATLNANPIILDASGRVTSEVWLQGGGSYKFVVTDSNNVQVGISWDNISGVNDANYNPFSEWVSSGMTPVYVSGTSFTVSGNAVSTLQVGRRLQWQLLGGTGYGTIATSSFNAGTGLTTVTVTPDSTNLDSTLYSFSYGFMSAVNTSLPTVVYAPVKNATITGLTGNGAVDFTGSSSLTGPTPATSDNSQTLATTAYVSSKAFNSALPTQSSSTIGMSILSDGTNASWQPRAGNNLYSYTNLGGF